MIKNVFLVLFFFMTQQIVAQRNNHIQKEQVKYTDKPSTHGMMLMGNEKVYASHLPMFHSPHDYQIILLLEFSQESQAKYMADKKENPNETVYTLEPETFVLPEMVNITKKFKANIYRGHFERGGKKIMENIAVSIQQIIYFKKFDTKDTKPKKLQYILFGNSQEQFLAHVISAKPDFDENLSVSFAVNGVTNSVNQEVLQKLQRTPFLLVEFDEAENRKAFSWKNSQGLLKDTNTSIDFQNHKTLYIEFGDLE